MSALVRQRLRSCPKAATASPATSATIARNLFISDLLRPKTAQGVRQSRPENLASGDECAIDHAVVAHEDQAGQEVLNGRGALAAQRDQRRGAQVQHEE